MVSNVGTNKLVFSKRKSMKVSSKTVSENQMQAEWLEVQAAQDSPAMFRVLYNRYYEPIFRFVLRRTGDEALTADVCSQIFLKALQRLDSYTFRGVPFSAWLYRIASNEVNQHFRKAKKERVVSIEEQKVSDLAEEIEYTDTEGLLDNMIDLLDELKPADLEIIEMRFFENRPFKEIAEILGITQANAKMKTYRILGRLKKKLS